MKRIFIILFFSVTTTVLCGQSVEIEHWKIRELRIQIITETEIVYHSYDTISYISYQLFYNSKSQLIEKRYNFQRDTSKYNSEIYSYNSQGELFKTEIINTYFEFYSTFPPDPETVCTYYNANGDIDHIERKLKNGKIEISNYSYKDFKYLADGTERIIYLPIQIDIKLDSKLYKTILFKYNK